MLFPALVLFLVSLLFLFAKKLGLLFGSSRKLPPGPNTWQVLRKVSQLRKKPHIVFTDLAKIYGPIMSFRLGSQIVIVASSAETAKEILKTQDKNLSGRFLPSIYYEVPLAEQSSLAMSKECNTTWRFLRKISLNFIFSSKAVDSRADTRKAKLLEMVGYLKTKQGKVVRLNDLINSTIYNIVSDVLVSRDLFDITREGDESDEKIKGFADEIIDMISSSLGLSDLFPILRKIDFPGTKEKAMGIYWKIISIWEDIVKERRSERLISSSSARDFLDVLFDNALPDDQICLVIMELWAAGMESSSITAVWLLVELIRKPHILKRVTEEVAKAFNHHAIIDETILTDQSPYLQACIKETLRLHIPSPLSVPHRAIEACEIDDYIIPKDSIVLVNGWAISMDPESWKDAESFNPDRFLNESKNIDFRGNHFEYIPFGAGRRMCPGLNLALKNVQIVVASLVHYFDWSLPNGADPTQIDTSDKFGTVLKKETPLLLIPSLRDV